MLTDPDAPTKAQQREQTEPSEHIRPIPLVAAALTLMAVLFGAGYIVVSESFGRADLGDRRTLADLRGDAPGASGAVADGKTLYASHCVACHQPDGRGLPGVFPPLQRSEWVNGDERVLINILLHGIGGEIEVAGTTYNGAMPSFRQLGDQELAAVASWIRAQWSNAAPAIDAAAVERERSSSTRDTPFEGGAQLKALASAAE